MDFVRLIFFKVFWMLINVQKKFLENSDFKVACKTVFWSGISNKIFFSNQKFSFLNVIKGQLWPQILAWDVLNNICAVSVWWYVIASDSDGSMYFGKIHWKQCRLETSFAFGNKYIGNIPWILETYFAYWKHRFRLETHKYWEYIQNHYW